ncbi:hypothetical protein [Jannaschia sp. R86511]|uniref:hypothetical protein n=1 Tax=Jannaschia sp. R86511 TaxID=3093853 RepID=UPI0036D40DD4
MLAAGLVLGPTTAAAAHPVASPAGAVLPVPVSAGENDLLWVEVDEVGLGRLSRARVVRWQVVAHLAGAPEGRLTVQLAARGELAHTPTGVLVQVESCTIPWTEQRARCDGEQALLFPWHRVVPDTDGEPVPVGRLTPTESHWLLVSLTLPEATPQTSQLLRTQVGLGLTATGDERFPPDAPPAPPPTTSPPAPDRPILDRPTDDEPNDDEPNDDRPTDDRPTDDEPRPDAPRPDRGDGPAPSAGTGRGDGAGGGSRPPSADGLPGGRSPAGEISAAPSALARTGTGLLPPLLLGLGAVGAGLSLAGVARWRR